jgi:hypothetical protein
MCENWARIYHVLLMRLKTKPLALISVAVAPLLASCFIAVNDI